MQKTYERRHPHDDWSDMPPQSVGVGVRNEALLELYRNTLIDFGRR